MSSLPEIGYATQSLFRLIVAALAILALIRIVPHWRRLSTSGSRGGYASELGKLGSPTAQFGILALWIATLVVLATKGSATVPAAALHLLLSHCYFIRPRWTNLSRGHGAPGFVTFWLALAVFVLEVSTRLSHEVRSWALLGLQIDLAMILLSAAISKVGSGYLSGRGMAFGMANPMWGHFWPKVRKLSPRHPLFRSLDFLAWFTELLLVPLMLFPLLKPWGGILLALVFLFIATQIRLGLLCGMMASASLLFFDVRTWPGIWIEEIAAKSGSSLSSTTSWSTAPWDTAWIALIVGYTVVRALVLVGLWVNFFMRRPLPRLIQRAIDGFANTFGVILWRVFTYDVTHYFVEVRVGDRPTWRATDVVEAITLATLFSTRKYYPSRPDLFRERLLRHSRALQRELGAGPQEKVVYLFQDIMPGDHGFEHVPILRCVVDQVEQSVEIQRIHEDRETRASDLECASPGSYAPHPIPWPE